MTFAGRVLSLRLVTGKSHNNESLRRSGNSRAAVAHPKANLALRRWPPKMRGTLAGWQRAGAPRSKPMIRSFAFTTQGKLHSKDIATFLMPTLLADTNLFLWLDLEKPTAAETKLVLEDIFHFHPLSIEDCVSVSPSPKVEEYQ